MVILVVTPMVDSLLTPLTILIENLRTTSMMDLIKRTTLFKTQLVIPGIILLCQAQMRRGLVPMLGQRLICGALTLPAHCSRMMMRMR